MALISADDWEIIKKIVQKLEEQEEDIQDAVLDLKEIEDEESIPFDALFDEMIKRAGL